MLRYDVVGSWVDLVSRLDAGRAVARWAGTEPALAGVSGVRELASLTREGGDRARADEVLGALVRLAAADGGDDPDAVLVVLHLLAPGVYALVGRLADLDATGDMVALVVGQLAIEIRQFPWRRRHRSFAANLLMDTRRSVLRELGCLPGARPREVLVADGCAAWGELVNASRPPETDLSPMAELVDVLTWAARRRIVDPADLQLVWQVEHRRGDGIGAVAQVAAAWGVHERTVRRRRACAVAALRAAAPAYLAA